MGMTDPMMNYLEMQAVPPGFLEWLREWRNPTNSVLNKVLITSVKLGHSNVLQLVLQKEAVDVNAKLDEFGWTALHWAAWNQQVTIAELLVMSGADVNAKEHFGLTALHIAAMTDQVAMAELLRKFGADVNANANDGRTPLHLATMAQQMDMVEWLANNGADGNAKAANTFTPIAIALKDDRMDMVKTMWNAAYSKLEDLEKNTNTPVLSKLQEVFAGKELHIADTVFKFIRPVNFEDLKLTNEGGDSLIDLFKSHYDDLQKYVKMLGKVKEQQLQRGIKRKLLKPQPTSETPAKVAKKSDVWNP